MLNNSIELSFHLKFEDYDFKEIDQMSKNSSKYTPSKKR
jgi:hypothetical protein